MWLTAMFERQTQKPQPTTDNSRRDQSETGLAHRLKPKRHDCREDRKRQYQGGE